MAKWPGYVLAAAYEMGYDEPEGSIAAFATHWGGVDPKSLVHAVQTAKDDDWLFAILLLIHSAAPEAREVVVSLLASGDHLTRAYSALYLGILGDHRALPVLQALLTSPLPAPEAYPVARLRQARFEDARASAAYLIGTLGDPASTPALRAALQAAILLNQALVPLPATAPDPDRWDYDNAVHDLHSYQDSIVYAMGRLKAYGALVGFDGIADQLDLWRVHLVMG